MGTKFGKKRKKCRKKRDATKNVEEENSTLGIDDTNQRKILALVMWYLSPIDRLRRTIETQSSCNGGPRMDTRKVMVCYVTHPMHNSGRALMRSTQNLEKTLEI